MIFNLSEFFYNIIPGTFFLIFWYLRFEALQNLFANINSFVNNSLIFGIVLLIFALSVGLVLHGIWRTIKYFLQLGKEEIKGEEYLENSYLWAKNYRMLPEYFSSRAAVWSSFIIGLIISLIIIQEYYLYYFPLIVLFILMYYADHNKEIYAIKRTYDAVRRWK